MKNLIISILAAILTCQMDFWMWDGIAVYLTGVYGFTTVYLGLACWIEDLAKNIKNSRT